MSRPPDRGGGSASSKSSSWANMLEEEEKLEKERRAKLLPAVTVEYKRHKEAIELGTGLAGYQIKESYGKFVNSNYSTKDLDEELLNHALFQQTEKGVEQCYNGMGGTPPVFVSTKDCKKLREGAEDQTKWFENGKRRSECRWVDLIIHDLSGPYKDVMEERLRRIKPYAELRGNTGYAELKMTEKEMTENDVRAELFPHMSYNVQEIKDYLKAVALADFTCPFVGCEDDIESLHYPAAKCLDRHVPRESDPKDLKSDFNYTLGVGVELGLGVGGVSTFQPNPRKFVDHHLAFHMHPSMCVALCCIHEGPCNASDEIFFSLRDLLQHMHDAHGSDYSAEELPTEELKTQLGQAGLDYRDFPTKVTKGVNMVSRFYRHYSKNLKSGMWAPLYLSLQRQKQWMRGYYRCHYLHKEENWKKFASIAARIADQDEKSNTVGISKFRKENVLQKLPDRMHIAELKGWDRNCWEFDNYDQCPYEIQGDEETTRTMKFRNQRSDYPTTRSKKENKRDSRSRERVVGGRSPLMEEPRNLGNADKGDRKRIPRHLKPSQRPPPGITKGNRTQKRDRSRSHSSERDDTTYLFNKRSRGNKGPRPPSKVYATQRAMDKAKFESRVWNLCNYKDNRTLYFRLQQCAFYYREKGEEKEKFSAVGLYYMTKIIYFNLPDIWKKRVILWFEGGLNGIERKELFTIPDLWMDDMLVTCFQRLCKSEGRGKHLSELLTDAECYMKFEKKREDWKKNLYDDLVSVLNAFIDPVKAIQKQLPFRYIQVLKKLPVGTDEDSVKFLNTQCQEWIEKEWNCERVCVGRGRYLISPRSINFNLPTLANPLQFIPINDGDSLPREWQNIKDVKRMHEIGQPVKDYSEIAKEVRKEESKRLKHLGVFNVGRGINLIDASDQEAQEFVERTNMKPEILDVNVIPYPVEESRQLLAAAWKDSGQSPTNFEKSENEPMQQEHEGEDMEGSFENDSGSEIHSVRSFEGVLDRDSDEHSVGSLAGSSKGVEKGYNLPPPPSGRGGSFYKDTFSSGIPKGRGRGFETIPKQPGTPRPSNTGETASAVLGPIRMKESVYSGFTSTSTPRDKGAQAMDIRESPEVVFTPQNDRSRKGDLPLALDFTMESPVAKGIFAQVKELIEEVKVSLQKPQTEAVMVTMATKLLALSEAMKKIGPEKVRLTADLTQITDDFNKSYSENIKLQQILEDTIKELKATKDYNESLKRNLDEIIKGVPELIDISQGGFQSCSEEQLNKVQIDHISMFRDMKETKRRNYELEEENRKLKERLRAMAAQPDPPPIQLPQGQVKAQIIRGKSELIWSKPKFGVSTTAVKPVIKDLAELTKRMCQTVHPAYAGNDYAIICSKSPSEIYDLLYYWHRQLETMVERIMTLGEVKWEDPDEPHSMQEYHRRLECSQPSVHVVSNNAVVTVVQPERTSELFTSCFRDTCVPLRAEQQVDANTPYEGIREVLETMSRFLEGNVKGVKGLQEDVTSAKILLKKSYGILEAQESAREDLLLKVPEGEKGIEPYNEENDYEMGDEEIDKPKQDCNNNSLKLKLKPKECDVAYYEPTEPMFSVGGSDEIDFNATNQRYINQPSTSGLETGASKDYGALPQFSIEELRGGNDMNVDTRSKSSAGDWDAEEDNRLTTTDILASIDQEINDLGHQGQSPFGEDDNFQLPLHSQTEGRSAKSQVESEQDSSQVGISTEQTGLSTKTIEIMSNFQSQEVPKECRQLCQMLETSTSSSSATIQESPVAAKDEVVVSYSEAVQNSLEPAQAKSPMKENVSSTDSPSSSSSSPSKKSKSQKTKERKQRQKERALASRIAGMPAEQQLQIRSASKTVQQGAPGGQEIVHLISEEAAENAADEEEGMDLTQ